MTSCEMLVTNTKFLVAFDDQEGTISDPARWGHCVVFLGKTHLTVTVPLSTQEYKWILANCQEAYVLVV